MLRPKRYLLGGLLGTVLAVGSSARAEIIFERTYPQAILDRFEIRSVEGTLPRGLSAVDLEQRIAEARLNGQQSRSILRIELLRDPGPDGELYFRRTSLYLDKIKAAASQAWFQDARKRYSVGESGVDDIKPDGSFDGGLGDLSYLRFGDDEQVGVFEQFFRESNQPGIRLRIDEAPRAEIDEHQFLRSFIRKEGCRVKKRSFGYVIESWAAPFGASRGRRRSSVYWLHGTNAQIEISSTRDVPWKFIDAYGERFPSRVSRQLEIDKTAWGREEMRFRLQRLESAVDFVPPEHEVHASDRFYLEIIDLVNYVSIPGLSSKISPTLTIEEKRVGLDRIKAWWSEHEKSTFWHDGISKLVAKGFAPEDLERQAQERREELLKTPIPDEDLVALKARLVQTLLEEYEEDVKRENRGLTEEKRGSKVETVGDRLIYTRLKKSGRHTYRTYLAPEIIRRPSDREQPLEGNFAVEIYDSETEKRTTAHRVYHYDRVADRWVLRRS